MLFIVYPVSDTSLHDLVEAPTTRDLHRALEKIHGKEWQEFVGCYPVKPMDLGAYKRFMKRVRPTT